MRRTLLRIAALGVAVTALGGFPAAARGEVAPPMYQVQDLGTLPGDYASVAMGMNQAGDVVGWSTGPTGTRAFLFTDQNGMQPLPKLHGRPVSTARAVNAAGAVVGTASTGGSDIGQAVRWQAGSAQDLGTLGTGMFSEARGINASGVVVGTSHSDNGSLLGIHAFRYDDAGGLVDLTPGADDAHAEGINDAGQIAGWREGRAFRLDGATFVDLGVPAGFSESFGFAVNASGQVAGHVITGSGNVEQIFRYTDGAGMVILGGVGEYNRSFAINTAGDVVGQGQPAPGPRQGFVYTDAKGMRGLNSLIDPGAGWFVLGATGINDAGQIAAWASGPSGQRAVRLTPADALTPPAAPSGLAGSVAQGSRVKLTWTDNATNETGFRIERSLGSDGQFTLLAQVGADVTSFGDKTTAAGNEYRYRVAAFNAAGRSAWSKTFVVVGF